jgi:hypothetical protein
MSHAAGRAIDYDGDLPAGYVPDNED